MANLFRNVFLLKKWSFQDPKTKLRLNLNQKRAIKPINPTVWNKVMKLEEQINLCTNGLWSKKAILCRKIGKFHLIFRLFIHTTFFLFLSKTINAVYLTVGNKVMQFWSLKEFLHKWGMVKNSHFLPENQKIHHTFQNYHFNNNPVYSTVILCWRTKSEPYKKKLCTNG